MSKTRDMKKDFKTQITTDLRLLRKNKRITQTQLGKNMGVSHAAVSDVENGKTHLTLELIEKYGKALGYEVKIHVDFVEKLI